MLVTRDPHFTNPVRFDPSVTAGILHIVHGNLTGSEEAELVGGFLRGQRPETYAGRLVLVSRGGTRIR